MFVLIDCNNFYASCEKIFNPKLKNKAVVVLSNNDGCVIARSKEAKKLNIKMGDPIFKYKDLIKAEVVSIFSSNFTLYGDMSNRVMKTLESFMYPMEIYSIDEAFLYIDEDLNKDAFFELAKKIKTRVYRWTNIDVSVGIAKTKTLAKLSNEIAKKQSGIMIFLDDTEINNTLKKTHVDEIWGIGKGLKKSLYKQDIYSAYDLKNADDLKIKNNLSINVLKTAWELRGNSTFDIEEIAPSKKSICSSRSFSSKIENIEDLEEAISSFAKIASQKLREEKLLANYITVFIQTSFFAKDHIYSNFSNIVLPRPTSYTSDIIFFAKKALNKIFKKGYLYKKAGIILSDFTTEIEEQKDLFLPLEEDYKKKLMSIVDSINYRANKDIIFFGAEGIIKKYESSAKMKSKKYTTSFDELLTVK